MRRLAVGVLVSCLGAFGAGACGGDSDSDAGGGRDESPPAEEDSTTTAAAADAGCPDAPFTVDLRAADALAGHAPFEDEAFEVTDTIAVKLAGSAYTAYLADYALDPEDFGTFETPHPPAGRTLVTVAITVFNPEGTPPPLEVGEVVPAGADFGERTFVVFVERGADAYNYSSNAEGEVEIREVSDERICFDVDYRDFEGNATAEGGVDALPVQKRLVGTVSAELVGFGP